MVLVLGGTRFLGRHIVEALAASGHEVTCFHRGNARCALPAGVREIFGDRNDPLPPELRAQWDAVVDVSGQQPQQVERSRELESARYLFISTLNVYADLSQPGTGEDAATVETYDESDPAAAYGGRKAACERLVLERYDDRATILRPGIIAGVWDYTERLTYWPRHALRGGRFEVPAPPERPLQFIDARDLAAFAVRAIQRKIGGIFNTVAPAEPYSLGEFARACAEAAGERGVRAEPLFVSAETLIARGVEPWTDIPMWLEDSAFAGLFQTSNARALAVGLQPRPPIDTARALMDWIGSAPVTR